MLKRGIFSKIFGLVTITSFIVGVFILVISIRERTQAVEDALIQENKLLAKVAAINIESGYYAHILPLEALKRISESENILFLWVVKPSGKIYLADNPRMLGKFIDDSFLGTEKTEVRNSSYPEDGEKIKLIIQPIKIREKQGLWNLFLGVSLKPVAAAKRAILIRSIYFLVLIIVFIGLISFYLTRKITKPLENLKKGAAVIGKGNLDFRIKMETGDEMEELGKAFNQMAESLRKYQIELEESKVVLEIKVKARTKELEELTQNLEERVKERTKEIQERLKELERFHRLTVGRELKMIELKKEIKELRKEIKDIKI